MPDRSPHNEHGWWSKHLWQIQPLRDVLVIFAVIGVVALGYQLRSITVPMLLAMALAYLFEPLVRKLTSMKRGRVFSRRGVAVIIIMGALLAVIVPVSIGLTMGAMQGVTYAQGLSNKVKITLAAVDKPEDANLSRQAAAQGPAWAKITQTLRHAKAEHERLAAIERGESPPVSSQQPDAMAAMLYRAGTRTATWVQEHAQQIGQHALDAGGTVAALVAGALSSLGSILFGGFLTAFFFFFFCTGWGNVLKFWQSLIPERKKSTVIDLLAKMDRVIAGFIRGRLLICAILAVYYTLAYYIIGVPTPLILGPLVGVLCLLPFIGQIGIPVAIALLWLGGGGGDSITSAWWWSVFAPIVVHVIGQVLDDYVLTPRIQGDTTGMDTPTILFASISGGILAGFYGLLVAIPVAACLRILIREIVWPRFEAWAKGAAKDPLPVAEGNNRG